MGYGYTAISNYENGKNEPSIRDLCRIAYHFKTPLEYLVGYDVLIQELEEQLTSYGRAIIRISSLHDNMQYFEKCSLDQCPFQSDVRREAAIKLAECPEQLLPIITAAIDAGIAYKAGELAKAKNK